MIKHTDGVLAYLGTPYNIRCFETNEAEVYWILATLHISGNLAERSQKRQTQTIDQ